MSRVTWSDIGLGEIFPILIWGSCLTYIISFIVLGILGSIVSSLIDREFPDGTYVSAALVMRNERRQHCTPSIDAWERRQQFSLAALRATALEGEEKRHTSEVLAWTEAT
ncbi:MAG: hypothetical protein MPN21_23000 [Thermoanaerobaculia bacterium]|nr:hypothetical protein [Thermoanaerobaculia bacterium]